jgi:hypothetical protein
LEAILPILAIETPANNVAVFVIFDARRDLVRVRVTVGICLPRRDDTDVFRLVGPGPRYARISRCTIFSTAGTKAVEERPYVVPKSIPMTRKGCSSSAPVGSGPVWDKASAIYPQGTFDAKLKAV